jgi:hypothetical protein
VLFQSYSLQSYRFHLKGRDFDLVIVIMCVWYGIIYNSSIWPVHSASLHFKGLVQNFVSYCLLEKLRVKI